MTLAEAPIIVADADHRPKANTVLALFAQAVGLAAILAAYVFFLSRFYAPAIIHPDANGYWAQASLLMETGRTWFKPGSNAQYIGMHWLLTPSGAYISRYPPGLAVLVGLVWKAFGWQASVLVNPVLAALTLVGVFLIVRRLASAAWALAACTLLAMNAPFTVQAVTNISHMPVAFCLVWGIALLLRWSDTGRIGWAFVAGLVLGCIPTIRYADSVIAVGVAAFLLGHWRSTPRIGRHVLAAIAGAVIPVLPLLVRNQLLLGRFWRTGYALTNEQTGFGWDYFKQNAVGYLQALQGSGLGMMFALGLFGFVWMIATPRRRSLGVMLLLSSTSLILVYMAYYWAMGIVGRGPGGGGPGGPGGGALRFLVPIVPVYVIAGTWALSEATRHAGRAVRIVLPLLVLAMQATMFGPGLCRELADQHARKEPLVLVTRGLEGVTSRDDVVLAGNMVLQHLDFVRRWKLADPMEVNGGYGGPGGMGGPGMRGGPGGFGPPGGPMGPDPDAPSPMQAEKREARAHLYTGTLDERREQFRDDLLAWAGGKAIYVVGNEAELARLLPGVDEDQLTIVKRIPTPKPPDDQPLERPDAPGPGGFGGPGGFRAQGGGPGMRGGFGPGGGGPGGFGGGPGMRGGFGPGGGGDGGFGGGPGMRGGFGPGGGGAGGPGGGPGMRGGFGPGGGGPGGPGGPGLIPGEDIVIARYHAPAE